MKTIKFGKLVKPPNKWWVNEQVGCSVCGGRFELEINDAVKTLQNCNNAVIFGEIKCPTEGCKHLISFSK